MTIDNLHNTDLEPERYELWTGDEDFWESTRRDFFRIVSGGIVVALVLSDALREATAQAPGRAAGRLPREIGAWLHIGQDNVVTVFTGKVEIGQNIRTSLTQVVAEELHVPLGRIKLVMADTDLTPFDAGTKRAVQAGEITDANPRWVNVKLTMVS